MFDPSYVGRPMLELVRSSAYPPHLTARGTTCPLPPAQGLLTALPPVAPLALDQLVGAIPSRRSCKVAGSAPLPLAALAALLRTLAADQPVTEFSVRLETFVAAVEVTQLPSATYRYDAQDHGLARTGKVSRDLLGKRVMTQLDHAAAPAVLFLVTPLAELLRRWGDHGYRLAAFTVGGALDGLYLVAEALNLPCSATGGFAAASADSMLGISGTGWTTFLGFVVGGPRA